MLAIQAADLKSKKAKLKILLLAGLFSISLLGNPPNVHATQMIECKSGTYLNSGGSCVKRPTAATQVPAGATALCRDGSYSFSQSRRGTCSYHGGVRTWL